MGPRGRLKPEVPSRPEGIFFWAFAGPDGAGGGAGHGDSEVRQPGWLSRGVDVLCLGKVWAALGR